MSSEHTIYLDNNATTRCDPTVVAAMTPFFTEWYGNAATGLHSQGRRAARAIDIARQQVANLIRSYPDEIVFTSGATESNNLAILGLARRALNRHRTRIVTTAVEHKAVLEPCRLLTKSAFELVVLPVDSQGCVDLAAAKAAIDSNTLLVSIQAANNEIGTLQPVAAIAAIAHAVGAIVHCDAAQAIGKIPVDVSTWDVDLLSLSAHKFYGPKGIGVLYIRNGPRAIPLEPLIYGGGQEHNIRSGTSNVPAIVGLGAAAQICATNLPAEIERIAEIRQTIESQLPSRLIGSWINGIDTERLPNTISLTIPGIDADALLLNMSEIMLGVGSACSTGAMEPSHVLQAIGLSRADAASTIRLSLGRFNHLSEVPHIMNQIVYAVQSIKE